MKDVKRYFLIFAFVIGLIAISERILFVVFPTYLIQRNFSATQIGLVFSIAGLFLIIARTYIGKLSDLIGRKGIMSIGLVASSIATAFYPLAQKLWHFILLKGFKETSDTLESSVETALQADVFKKNIRANIMAKLGSILPFARAIAMTLGFVILTWLSIEYSFYLSALFIFIAFLVFFIFFKEKKTGRRKFKYSLSPFKYPKIFNVLILIGFIQALTFNVAYFPGFFILAENYLMISPQMLFILFLISYLISSLFVYPSGKWIDRFGRKNMALFGIFFFNLLILCYIFVENVFHFLIVLVFISVVYYIWRVAYKTAVMDQTRMKDRGEKLGFYKSVEGFGTMLGPLIGGLLIDNVSIQAPFIFAGVVGIGFAAVIFFSRILHQ
jgi:MFS family permease